MSCIAEYQLLLYFLTSAFALFSLYLPCTGGHAVHTRAHFWVFDSLRGHLSQLHTHLAADPENQVQPAHSQREAHPGHCVDLLHLLVAIPRRQHGASMSHFLFSPVRGHFFSCIQIQYTHENCRDMPVFLISSHSQVTWVVCPDGHMKNM